MLRFFKSLRKIREFKKAVRLRDAASFMQVWGNDNLTKEAAKVIAGAGLEFIQDLANFILDKNVDLKKRSHAACALSRAIELNQKIASNQNIRIAISKATTDFDYYVSQNMKHAQWLLMSPLEGIIMGTRVSGKIYKTKKEALDELRDFIITDNQSAYELICRCYFLTFEPEVKSGIKRIFTEHPNNSVLLKALLELNKLNPLKYTTQNTLEAIRIIGPSPYLFAWEYVLRCLTLPHFTSNRNIQEYERALIEKAEEIVAKHKLPIPVAIAWLKEIDDREFAAFMDREIVIRIVGICEVLVRQYPDKIEIADIFAQLIERAYTVNRVFPGAWPDERAMAKIIPLLKQSSEPVALAGLVSILKQQYNRNLLLEGTKIDSVWGTSVIYGPDPNKVFRVTIDCLIEICKERAEGLLLNLASELGGSLRAEHSDYIKKRRMSNQG